MSRIMLATTALALALTTTLVLAAPTLASPPVPADMLLAPPPFIEATRASVPFSHELHDKAGVACVTCHHTWDGKEEIGSCSVAGCHDQPGRKGETTFYSAFHARDNDASCLSCHRSIVQEGGQAPIACKDCHIN